MLATERYLFVIRDEVLWQFDIDTLQVVHQHRFPRTTPRAVAGAAPDAPVVEAPPVVAGRRAAAAEPPPSELPKVEATTVGSAVDSALHWLATHQDADGKWDCDQFMKHDAVGDPCEGPGNPVHDVGATGLSMLALLGSGSTLRQGPYKEHLKKAAKWLQEQQQENGLFGVNASHDFIYDHAIATYAMCEAYGLSNYQMLKPAAQKGLDYLESHRNPYSVWRYQPRDNDNDTSVTTWALLAMASGNQFGLNVNQEAMKIVGVWYDQVTTPDGRAGYTKAGEPSSRKPGDHSTRFPPESGEAMTAAALFGRLILGQTKKDHPILKVAADRVAAKPPQWQPGHVDAVYWFFGSFAMYQMGGKHWETWRRGLDELVAHQQREGNAKGSWDPEGVWDEDGGRIFVTALYALSLQTAARAARLVR